MASDSMSGCRAAFPVLAFAFQPKTLAFGDPWPLPLLTIRVSVHTCWFGFRFHFCFLAAGEFPLLSCELNYSFERMFIFYPEFSDAFVLKGRVFQVIAICYCWE